MFDNTTNQSSKLRTENYVQIVNDRTGVHGVADPIKFQNTMLKSNFCDYCDAYLLVKENTTVVGEGEVDVVVQSINKYYSRILLHFLAACYFVKILPLLK